MTTTVNSLPVDQINVQDGFNARSMDPADEATKALAGSVKEVGIIVPLIVSNGDGKGYTLVAGHRRLAAAKLAGLTEVPVVVRLADTSTADAAVENIARAQLNALEEAHAVRALFDVGYTPDGAATILGWSKALVTARMKILELPEAGQALVGDGRLALGDVATLLEIAQVSTDVRDLLIEAIDKGHVHGLSRDLGWTIKTAVRGLDSKVWLEYLSSFTSRDAKRLKLGKKFDAMFEEGDKLQTDSWARMTVRFADAEIDQARAAGVLIEHADDTPIITDEPLFKELCRQALPRAVQEARQAKANLAAEKRSTKTGAKTPVQLEESAHRKATAGFTLAAHSVNLDIGAKLLTDLRVKASDMDVARFFVYGLLGYPDAALQGGSMSARTTVLAANGIRLVFPEHRLVETKMVKPNVPGKTKISYPPENIEAAAKWLWSFVDGAKTADELYTRGLLVFAAQHYAKQTVLPTAKRANASCTPMSKDDIARKAFERLTESVLPATLLALDKAILAESRRHDRKLNSLASGPDVPVSDDE